MSGQIYYYGRLCHSELVEVFGDEPPEVIRQWCEAHRRQVLPQVVEFEAYIAGRYGADFQKIALGPYGRRDEINRLITRRGEWNLPLKHLSSGVSMTLREIYAQLYQNGVADFHENGDGC